MAWMCTARFAEISTVSAFSSPSISAAPLRTAVSASRSPLTRHEPEARNARQWMLPASREPDALSSSAVSARSVRREPETDASPSTCTDCAEKSPEADRLPQRTLPAILPAPLVCSSPAQSTSPCTFAAPEQCSSSHLRLPLTLPAPLIETLPYSPPGMVLEPEIFISMCSFIMFPPSDAPEYRFCVRPRPDTGV